MKEIEDSLEEYRNVRKAVLDVALAGKRVEAQAEMEEIEPVLEKFQGRLSALAEYTSKQAEIVKDENIEAYKTNLNVFMGIFILSIIISLVVTELISRSIVKPLKGINNFADRMKNADFSKHIELDRKDELGQTAASLNEAKGFVVVAEEVRTLAEESSKAVIKIQETTLEVIEAFTDVKENSTEVLNFMENNIKPQIENLISIGDSYYKDSEFVSSMSENIASMSEEISATMNQVSSAIQGMASQTEISNDKASNIKLGINEATLGIEEVAKSAPNQAYMAQKLNELIEKFKI